MNKLKMLALALVLGLVGAVYAANGVAAHKKGTKKIAASCCAAGTSCCVGDSICADHKAAQTSKKGKDGATEGAAGRPPCPLFFSVIM